MLGEIPNTQNLGEKAAFMKRIFLIVLDSVGIGALPDAEKFGDTGADTMRRISASESFCAAK